MPLIMSKYILNTDLLLLLLFKVQYFHFHGHYLPLTLSRIIIIIMSNNIKTQFVHLW